MSKEYTGTWEEPVPQPEPPKRRGSLYLHDEGGLVGKATLADIAKALGGVPVADLEALVKHGSINTVAATRGFYRSSYYDSIAQAYYGRGNK